MVDKFPTCGKFWKQYIEHEMKNGNYENVEKLFKRCLVSGKNLNSFLSQFSALSNNQLVGHPPAWG